MKSKAMKSLSGRTPSPASEFNENKIKSLTTQILRARREHKTPEKELSSKKKSMMPQHLKEYKSQKIDRKIPVAQIAIETIRRPEEPVKVAEPEIIPNRSARLNRTRSIL